MDTIRALEPDSVSAAFTEQPQTAKRDYSPFEIFKMGIIGVFTFVVFYMLTIKLTAIVTKKYKKKRDDDA
ncbi:MAG: hypothetical protein FWH36_09210 [Lentimicrobiaceae bacterium]|nr:hypothetical protein [Lentimicrobiaceae bacterium]